MTKSTFRWLASLTAALALTAGLALLQAQSALTQTTLSAAVTSTSTTTISVTSATGITANSSYLIVDAEAMYVRAVSGTTLTVSRGVLGTPAATHPSGAVVFEGAAAEFYNADPIAGSTCTSANELYLPHIFPATGHVFDCLNGVWSRRVTENTTIRGATVFVYPFTARDNFDQGYLIMQDDGTAQSLTDDEDNFVYGSPLGAIEYREELTKTTSSWVTSAGVLDVSADDTVNDEGVEILFGTGELGGFILAGTNGACISASITIADISGTDQVQIGFRDNGAFPDVAAYAGMTVWNSVGVNNVDGSIVSSQEVSEATDTDDSAVNWADGETRALKVCVSAAGVPTAFYSAASPGEFPVYVPITMTNTGSTLTAATLLAPFFSYLAAGTDGADVTVNWVQLERLPR